MRARIVKYDKYISSLLEADSTETSWQQVREDLLVQIGFFQHERLSAVALIFLAGWQIGRAHV